MAVVFVDLTATYDRVWKEQALYEVTVLIPCQKTWKLINNILADQYF